MNSDDSENENNDNAGSSQHHTFDDQIHPSKDVESSEAMNSDDSENESNDNAVSSQHRKFAEQIHPSKDVETYELQEKTNVADDDDNADAQSRPTDQSEIKEEKTSVADDDDNSDAQSRPTGQSEIKEGKSSPRTPSLYCTNESDGTVVDAVAQVHSEHNNETAENERSEIPSKSPNEDEMPQKPLAKNITNEIEDCESQISSQEETSHEKTAVHLRKNADTVVITIQSQEETSEKMERDNTILIREDLVSWLEEPGAENVARNNINVKRDHLVDWLNAVDDPTPKKVCCLRVADTNEKVNWDKNNFNVTRGDHIAWLNTLGGYWHHAIVQTVSDEKKITVIEWSRNGNNFKIKQGVVTQGEWSSLQRPMYKILYPQTVLNKNPADVVVRRAELGMSNKDGYNLVTNNCEHFARYCKTGKKYSHQVLQGYGSVTVWTFRVLLDILKVIAFVFFSELIESYTSWSFEQVSILILLVFEFIYLMVAVHLIVFKDEKLSTLPNGRYCFPIGCAIGRLAARSAIIWFFASLFMIYIPPLFGEMPYWEEILVSSAFGLLGGIIGVLISYIAFYLTPCFMCCLERGVIEKNKKKDSNVKNVDESKVDKHAESSSTNC